MSIQCECGRLSRTFPVPQISLTSSYLREAASSRSLSIPDTSPMLRITTIALSTSAAYGFVAGSAPATRGMRSASPAMSVFFDQSATALDGSAVDFSAYKGKPTLILNVASL